MTWLPSFVKLFLIFVAGVVLNISSIFIDVAVSYSYTVSSIAMTLRLLGLALMLISPVLIALKFFAQLDRKSN